MHNSQSVRPCFTAYNFLDTEVDCAQFPVRASFSDRKTIFRDGEG